MSITSIRPMSGLKGAVFGLLLIGLYYSSHAVMVSGWKRDDYSYCYLVPLVILYLIWKQRGRLASIPAGPSAIGFLPLLLGIGLYWLGELGGEFYTLYLSSWLVLIGLLWVHLGWQKLKVLAFPLFMILAMFPLPNFLYTKISVKLQLISSQLGVEMLRLYGMSAYREGNIIDIGYTQLQVVEACSGLRYIIPLVVLSLLLAYFFRAALWKRAVVFLSSVPLAVLTNSLRIAVTGVLYELWGREAAEGFFHGVSGWLIFMFSFLILLIEMRVLSFKFYVLSKKHQALGKKDSISGKKSSVLGLKFNVSDRGENGVTGYGGNVIREKKEEERGPYSPINLKPGPLKPNTYFFVAFFLLGATIGLSRGVEFREQIPITRPLAEFPMQLGAWSGSRMRMEQRFIDTLDLSDYVMMDFQDGQGRAVNFYVAYYESQRKGKSIHTPATCLPGSGWIFERAGATIVPMGSGRNHSMKINRAYMTKSGARELVYYWFPQRGRVLTNAYQLKLYNFWDALTRRRTDGALVRLVTPVYKDETVMDAEERLQGFLRGVVTVLDEFLPK